MQLIKKKDDLKVNLEVNLEGNLEFNDNKLFSIKKEIGVKEKEPKVKEEDSKYQIRKLA